MSDPTDDAIRFARQSSAKSVAASPLTAASALRTLDRLAHVPGLTKCSKCGFSLLSNNLHAETGQVSARDEPSICPNDGSPMRRVTERQAGNDLLDRWDREMPVWHDAGTTSVSRIEELLAEHGQRNVRLYPDGHVAYRVFPAENSPSDMAAAGGLPPLSAHDEPLTPIPKGET